MKFPDKVYNILKWLCLVAIPALETFIGVLLPTLDVTADVTTKVVTIISAIGAFIGVLIGISNVAYKVDKEE